MIGNMSMKNWMGSKSIFLSVFLLGMIIYTSVGMLSPLAVANAHSLPVTESPAPDSIIKKGEPLPSKVIIDFSERPEPSVSTITVLNEKNVRVDDGNFSIIGDHSREAMTMLDTKKLFDGVYTVSWMTQSLDDGHIARGSYVFGIGNVGPSGHASIVGTNQQNSQVQAVTSNWDGLIKWPLLISQATVVGCIFSHLFLWKKFGEKIKINPGRSNSTRPRSLISDPKISSSVHVLKRITMMLVAVSIAIISASAGLLFIQIAELSTNNISGTTVIFISLLHGPSGTAWLVRTVTSIIVLACAITYYFKKKNTISGIEKYDHARLLSRKRVLFSSSSLLYFALISGSVSIFANSATSHNAAVTFIPSLAVSLDWLHFMAVSVWVGGLFYISTILLVAIRYRAKETVDWYESPKIDMAANSTRSTFFTRNILVNHYYLALLLPRFSLLATVSLGVIGISGIYMAWIHLNNLGALFSTTYGNILIIKLAVALPLILLGGYHQLKLHKAIVSVASLGKAEHHYESYGNNNLQIAQNIDNSINKNNTDDIVKSHNRETKRKKNEGSNKNQGDIFSKFTKTIKIESIIALIVLLVASILTITSPSPMNPDSMNMNMSSSSTAIPNGAMHGMAMNNIKNSSFVKEVKILGINTKIEVNPFHSGFNTFKITFTDVDKKPYSKILAVRMIFRNDQADIGPITTNLKPISAGVYSITGGYISQPGQWNIAIAVQRPSDYDLNYRFSNMITQFKESNNAGMLSSSSDINIQERMPIFDSFAILAIVLAVMVGLGSAYYYKKSKRELKHTLELLRPDAN